MKLKKPEPLWGQKKVRDVSIKAMQPTFNRQERGFDSLWTH